MATLRNHTSNENSGQDSPLQTQQDANAALAIGYVREFSCRAAAFQQQRTEETLVYVQRSVALLGTKVQPHHFAPLPGNLELARFYVDLHALMGALDTEGSGAEVLWSCVALIQHCSRNLEARRAIVVKFCFVPLLGMLLRRTRRTERVHRLLVLLQDLTYGIRIDWEEPYLAALLEHLAEIVHGVEDGSENGNGTSSSKADEEENSHALLALSILVNLCYKNFAVLFLFQRIVNISGFCRRIQNYGLLAYKMLIILSEEVHAFEQRELHTFLRTAFAGMEDCLKHWNVAQLRHIVDFLLDSQSHAGLHRAMLSHSHYCEDVEKLLDQIDARNAMDDSQEESRKYQQICMDLIFRLIGYVLELSEQDPDNNVISLDAITPRLFELVVEWLSSELCGVAATELLTIMLRVGKRATVAQSISREPLHVVGMVASAERPDTKPAQTVAILRLLLALLKESKTEKLVLSKISESYFDKILAAPLALVPQFLSTQSLAQSEAEKACFCLLLLVHVAGIAKKAYLDKCCSLLEKPQLQYCLARGMVSQNETLVAAVLQIAQFEHFPKAAVAKYVSAIGKAPGGSSPAASVCGNDQAEQWRNLSSILKGHRTFTDKEMAQRVNALLESIGGIVRRNELASAPVSQVIELYNHRIDSLNGVVANLQQRLDQAGQQLISGTQLSHVQSAELERFQTTNFELLISQERLQTQCKDLKQQTDKLKSSMNNLLKHLSENAVNLQNNERRLEVKKAEIAGLKKDCEDLRTSLSAKSEELTKLEAVNKENSSRIDKLKKSMVAFEQDIKEKVRTIEERERELAKTHKALEEQREGRKKSEDLVSVLEKQLQERKEQIENLEMEQKETEDLRKTIMSLMESKKPKRKAC
ncbi:uncharacterized protein Dana_GF20464 [Drosophila ananassae]|uniref:Uncharacterized protein n=1 Tax=Drosophila ananassae TaxID=7217 RepID=B3MQL8_DROAN|nr:uncharacterized protein LOC6503170 [Drosophila ananassae]EDV44644.1 uncharacterized protein Dana_GF20464 [Drosophila ananassae]